MNKFKVVVNNVAISSNKH